MEVPRPQIEARPDSMKPHRLGMLSAKIVKSIATAHINFLQKGSSPSFWTTLTISTPKKTGDCYKDVQRRPVGRSSRYHGYYSDAKDRNLPDEASPQTVCNIPQQHSSDQEPGIERGRKQCRVCRSEFHRRLRSDKADGNKKHLLHNGLISDGR